MQIFPRVLICAWIAAGLIAFSACNEQPAPPEASAQCAGNQAQIQVQDGFLQILCGCAEAAGTRISGQGSLNCTIAAGKTVVFNFSGARLRHQIFATGNPLFESSPVYDPSGPIQTVTYSVSFQTPATYTYQDAFFTDLKGAILVR